MGRSAHVRLGSTTEKALSLAEGFWFYENYFGLVELPVSPVPVVLVLSVVELLFLW